MSKHHARILTGRPWARTRLQILARDGGRCQIKAPGCTDIATQVDHIVPLAKGGAPFDPQNLRACCRHCNNARNVEHPRVDTTWTW